MHTDTTTVSQTRDQVSPPHNARDAAIREYVDTIESIVDLDGHARRLEIKIRTVESWLADPDPDPRVSAEMWSALKETRANLLSERAAAEMQIARARARSRELSARLAASRATTRHRVTARPARCQRSSRRARTVARVAAKTTSTGDPDPEPDSSARASSSGGAS